MNPRMASNICQRLRACKIFGLFLFLETHLCTGRLLVSTEWLTTHMYCVLDTPP